MNFFSQDHEKTRKIERKFNQKKQKIKYSDQLTDNLDQIKIGFNINYQFDVCCVYPLAYLLACTIIFFPFACLLTNSMFANFPITTFMNTIIHAIPL